MQSTPRPRDRARRRPATTIDLTGPECRLILRACAERARTPRYLSTVLDIPRPALNTRLQQLAAAGLLTAEAPCRIDGRLVIPYRTMPRASIRRASTQRR